MRATRTTIPADHQAQEGTPKRGPGSSRRRRPCPGRRPGAARRRRAPRVLCVSIAPSRPRAARVAIPYRVYGAGRRRMGPPPGGPLQAAGRARRHLTKLRPPGSRSELSGPSRRRPGGPPRRAGQHASSGVSSSRSFRRQGARRSSSRTRASPPPRLAQCSPWGTASRSRHAGLDPLRPGRRRHRRRRRRRRGRQRRRCAPVPSRVRGSGPPRCVLRHRCSSELPALAGAPLQPAAPPSAPRPVRLRVREPFRW